VAAVCPYCDRPFAAASARDLHVGEVHDAVRSAAEAAAYERAREAERDDLFYYHLRVVAALGVVSHDEVDPDPRTRRPPSEPVALGYLVLFGFAAGIALLTFERGIAVAVSLVPALATLDVGSLLLADLLVMVLFFGSWAATTWSLDRLVVGGVRWALGD